MTLKKKNIKKKITKGGYRSINPFIVSDKINPSDKLKLQSTLDKCIEFDKIKDNIKTEDIHENPLYQCITPLFAFKKFIGNDVNYILLDSLDNVIEFNLLKKDENIYIFKVTVKYDVELIDIKKWTDDLVQKVKNDTYVNKFIDDTYTYFYTFTRNQSPQDYGLDENYIMDVFSTGFGLVYSELYKTKLMDLLEDQSYFQKIYFKHDQQYIIQNSVNICSIMIFLNLFVELLHIVNNGSDIFDKSIINRDLKEDIDETLEYFKPNKILQDRIDSIFEIKSKNNTKKNNNNKSKTKKSKLPLFAIVYNKLQDERKTQFGDNFMELILNILIECKVFNDVNNNIDVDLIIEYLKNHSYISYVIKKILESDHANIKTISTQLKKKSKDIIISLLCINSLNDSLTIKYSGNDKNEIYKKIVYGLNYLNTAKLYRALLSKHEKLNEIKSNNVKKDEKQKKIYKDMKKDLDKLNMNIITNEFEHFYTLIRSLQEMVVSISDTKFKQTSDFKYNIHYDTFKYRFTSMIFQSYFIDLLKIDYTPLFPFALQSFKPKFKLFDFTNYRNKNVKDMIENIKKLNEKEFKIINQLSSSHINYNGVDLNFPNCVETCLYNTIRYLLTDFKKHNISLELVSKIPSGNLVNDIIKKLINNNNHSEYLQEFTLLTVNHSSLEYYKEFNSIKYELYGDITNFTKALSLLLNMNYNDSIKPLENLIIIFNNFDKKILPNSNDEQINLSETYYLLLYKMHADFKDNIKNEEHLQKYFSLFNREFINKDIFGNLREYYESYEIIYDEYFDYDNFLVDIKDLPEKLTKHICLDIGNIDINHNTLLINKIISESDTEKLKQFEIIINLSSITEIKPEHIPNCRELIIFNGIFSKDNFNNITLLKLGNEFNMELPELSKCNKLIFGSNFNQKLINGILPECEYIYLNYNFNSDIDENALPKIKKFICEKSSSFNKPIKNLPECEEIDLGNNFNSNISINALPKAKIIDLGGYNLPILKNMFPECINITLSSDFNSIVEEGAFPKAKTIVNFGLDPSLPLIPNIIPNVNEISFNINFNSTIELNSLANIYKIYLFNKNYNKPIKQNVLNKCAYLYINGVNSYLFNNISTIFEKGFAPKLQYLIVIDDMDNEYYYVHTKNNIWTATKKNFQFPETITLYHN